MRAARRARPPPPAPRGDPERPPPRRVAIAPQNETQPGRGRGAWGLRPGLLERVVFGPFGSGRGTGRRRRGSIPGRLSTSPRPSDEKEILPNRPQASPRSAPQSFPGAALRPAGGHSRGATVCRSREAPRGTDVLRPRAGRCCSPGGGRSPSGQRKASVTWTSVSGTGCPCLPDLGAQLARPAALPGTTRVRHGPATLPRGPGRGCKGSRTMPHVRGLARRPGVGHPQPPPGAPRQPLPL